MANASAVAGEGLGRLSGMGNSWGGTRPRVGVRLGWEELLGAVRVEWGRNGFGGRSFGTRERVGWAVGPVGGGVLPEKLQRGAVALEPALIDPRTGEVRRVELFVGVRGASRRTYAEATATV